MTRDLPDGISPRPVGSHPGTDRRHWDHMAANAPSIAGLVYLATSSEIQAALVERHASRWTKLRAVREVLGPIAEFWLSPGR